MTRPHGLVSGKTAQEGIADCQHGQLSLVAQGDPITAREAAKSAELLTGCCGVAAEFRSGGQVVEFTVLGQQRPQGSKIPQAIYRDGKPVVTKTGRVVTVVRNDNPHLESWRQQVAWAAKIAFGDEPLILGPVQMMVVFTLLRTKGHYGSGKNAGKIKASAPTWHTVKPDTIKLVRAIEDSCTGIVWRDDSQVCRHVLEKRWGEEFSTFVRIEEIQ